MNDHYELDQMAKNNGINKTLQLLIWGYRFLIETNNNYKEMSQYIISTVIENNHG